MLKLRMPKSCPGVDPKALNPRAVWSDKESYDAAAGRLREMFRNNFKEKGFACYGIREAM